MTHIHAAYTEIIFDESKHDQCLLTADLAAHMSTTPCHPHRSHQHVTVLPAQSPDEVCAIMRLCDKHSFPTHQHMHI